MLRYVEFLSEARTPHGKGRVSTRRGRAGEKSDFFSILLEEAMTVSIVWGLTLLAVLSPLLARARQIPAWKVIA
jgi:hypothetical protein